jgi:hypothetical protein
MFKEPHVPQVRRLALSLFDQLKGLHGFSTEEMQIVANTARYHRNSGPTEHRSHYCVRTTLWIGRSLFPFSPWSKREKSFTGRSWTCL